MANGRKALITGITGQDGSYLAELLLAKGYEVHGIKRRSSSFNTARVDHLLADWHERDTRLFLHFADLSDATSLTKLLYRLAPDEIYHLGAQSHVRLVSTYRNIRAMSRHWALRGCSTPSVNRPFQRGFTTPRAANYLGRHASGRRANPRRSGRAVHMAAQSSTAIG